MGDLVQGCCRGKARYSGSHNQHCLLGGVCLCTFTSSVMALFDQCCQIPWGEDLTAHVLKEEGIHVHTKK